MQFFTGFTRLWPAFLVMILFAGLFALFPGSGQVAVSAQASTATPTPSRGRTPTPLSPADSGSTPQRSITVNGSGKINAQPDLGIVILGVQTNAETASAALTDNNQQMQAVLTALNQAGIARTDVRTQSIQLYPQYDYPQQSQPGQTPTPPRLVGFTASNTVEVTIRDLENLGQVLDEVVTAGSNQIQGIRFDIEDQSELLGQARQAAFQDAQNKAQQLAGLANASLGPIISMSETSSLPVPYLAAAQEARVASNVPIMPGEQEVTVDVQITWQLQ